MSSFIGISRDRSQSSNCVAIDRYGDPIIHYRVTTQDRPMLLAGLEASLRMTYQAGARILFAAHSSLPWYIRHDNEVDPQAFEGYLHTLKQDKMEPLQMLVFTAHQMSSCRMAALPENGPVSPLGELYDGRNIFIADGSVLPTSLGINPMITIEAMSHMISQHVIRRLQQMQ
jgi:choline dehydrogenase-like flavoprotein